VAGTERSNAPSRRGVAGRGLCQAEARPARSPPGHHPLLSESRPTIERGEGREVEDAQNDQGITLPKMHGFRWGALVCGEVVHAFTQSVPVEGGRDRLASVRWISRRYNYRVARMPTSSQKDEGPPRRQATLRKFFLRGSPMA
jgi:hypothetical protein